MASSLLVEVRAPFTDEAETWAKLFREYREVEGFAPDETNVQVTWDWVANDHHDLHSLLAFTPEGVPVGLLNWHTFPRPLTATTGLYVANVYTVPAYRRRGVATVLLEAASVIAAEKGYTVVRWMAQPGNTAARRLYDVIAKKVDWIVYDAEPATPPLRLSGC